MKSEKELRDLLEHIEKLDKAIESIGYRKNKYSTRTAWRRVLEYVLEIKRGE